MWFSELSFEFINFCLCVDQVSLRNIQTVTQLFIFLHSIEVHSTWWHLNYHSPATLLSIKHSIGALVNPVHNCQKRRQNWQICWEIETDFYNIQFNPYGLSVWSQFYKYLVICGSNMWYSLVALALVEAVFTAIVANLHMNLDTKRREMMQNKLTSVLLSTMPCSSDKRCCNSLASDVAEKQFQTDNN